MPCIALQIWYYTSGILLEAGFVQEIVPYITLSTGGIETLAAIVSVSFKRNGANITTGCRVILTPPPLPRCGSWCLSRTIFMLISGMLTFGSADVEEIPSDANVKRSLTSSGQQLAGGSWFIGTSRDNTQP